MFEFLMLFTIMFLLVMIGIGIIMIPITIANARGICGGEKTAIVILSWMGIFLGITWLVALVLSLVWRGECTYAIDNLDRLEKLAKLYKDKVISKSEYDTMKAKLLGK